jgi:hydrogenase-4 component B
VVERVTLPAMLVVRLVTVAATATAARRPRACRWIAFGGAIAASIMTLAIAARVLASGQPTEGVLLRHAASGIVLGYAANPLSAWFLLVLSLIALPVAVYSIGYFAHAVAPSRTAIAGAAFNVLLGALEVVFAAADVVTFLFAWEVMSLATAALVTTEHQSRDSRRAAYLYLVMSHVGTGCLLAGFLLLAGRAGSIALPAVLAGNLVDGPARHGVFVLFLLGFGVKAGIIPLHVWLPEAHPAAPSSISALMSAVLITAGVYGLFRVCGFGLGLPDLRWGLTLMAAGTLSAILGVLYALTQNDVKRLLAYSTIENAGIVVLGLGAAMMMLAAGHGRLAAIAAAASLAHVLNHALFKALLFLGAGGIVMSTGTRQIERFGGLVRRMPWTAGCFLAGAMAISGLPLLNGFTSEWLTFQALLLGFRSTPGQLRLTFVLSAATLALTTALAAACFVRAFGISFLARPRSSAADEAHESPPIMLVPQVVLAFLCVALGLFPGAAAGPLADVARSLPGLTFAAAEIGFGTGMTSGGFDAVVPVALGLVLLGGLAMAGLLTRRRAAVRRAPTWGCGGELSARTEYTATAFSKPLVMIFRAIYRPTREVEALADVSPYFPREVRYRAAIEPTFERYVYAPLVGAVLRVAAGMKVLQAGSLHAYLAYVLVLGVLLLLWLGGTA